jgi:hypothetical protein
MYDSRFKHNSKPILWGKLPIIIGATYIEKESRVEAILVGGDTKLDLYKLKTTDSWFFEANYDTIYLNWELKEKNK